MVKPKEVENSSSSPIMDEATVISENENSRPQIKGSG
jgi:hypothetical protein